LVFCIELQVWRASGYTGACYTVPLLLALKTSPREKSSLAELALNQKIEENVLFSIVYLFIYLFMHLLHA